MAKNPNVFRRHGEGARAAASGGAREEATGYQVESSATSVTTVNRLEHFFIPVDFIVSQGCCESRQIIIYDHSANSVL